jgi:hypothetical protein
VDVEKYSRRRTVAQISVVDALTKCLKLALTEVSKQYIDYAQANGLNFDADIIKLPTGDGAAVVFPFEGLHDIHLCFATHLLKAVHQFNENTPCEKFAAHGWCNCHPNFNIRTGISEGKAIVYVDINGGYNVAGGVVNMAARAMGAGDRNQIIFTDEAYKDIVEMDENPQMVEKFVRYETPIKHNLMTYFYQFVDPSLPHLNSSPSSELELYARSRSVMSAMASSGVPIPDPTAMSNVDKKTFVTQMESFASALAGIMNEAKKIRQPEE